MPNPWLVFSSQSSDNAEGSDTYDSPILSHYAFALAHYIYSTILIVFDLEGVKQKDKYEMLLHHCVTMSLIVFSWQWKLFRAGIMVLALHDFADPFMEVAKMYLYSGRQVAANFWFAVFAIAFIGTRCIVFPATLIYPSMYVYILTEYH